MATINREALLSKQRLDVAFKMFDKVQLTHTFDILKKLNWTTYYFPILKPGWQWNTFNWRDQRSVWHTCRYFWEGLERHAQRSGWQWRWAGRNTFLKNFNKILKFNCDFLSLTNRFNSRNSKRWCWNW